MNLTGDGNGFDMLTMPQVLRARVPTANFFQQQGYERNPVARRTGVVANLIADIESKMAHAAQAQGARELAAGFSGFRSPPRVTAARRRSPRPGRPPGDASSSLDVCESLGQRETVGAGQEIGDVIGDGRFRGAVSFCFPVTPSKKNATGTFKICEMCWRRLAPIRFVPFSYFCTCWNVRPSFSPSFSCSFPASAAACAHGHPHICPWGSETFSPSSGFAPQREVGRFSFGSEIAKQG